MGGRCPAPDPSRCSRTHPGGSGRGTRDRTHTTPVAPDPGSPALPRGGAGSANRGQLRQRLLRRHPRHRRCARRPGPADRLRPGASRVGETSCRPVFHCGLGAGKRDRRDQRALVAAGCRSRQHPCRLVLHGWFPALWVSRPRRGHGLPVLRAGGDGRHHPGHLRCGPAGLLGGGHRDWGLGQCPAGGQQSPRPRRRRRGGQAHSRHPAG